jgi:nicotinamidase-related amidase
MSRFADRSNSALLVIDVQNGVLAGCHRREAVVGRIAELVERARVEGVAVIWVQHNSDGLVAGEDPWRIVAELAPDASEPSIQKRYGDCFEETELEEVLAGLAVGRLVVVGAQTDECVRSTLHGAFVRGYDTTLVGDAHTTEDHSPWGAPPPEQVIAHTNLYWNEHAGPGRTAETVAAAELHLAGPA